MELVLIAVVGLVVLVLAIKMFSFGLWLAWTALCGLFIGGVASTVFGARNKLSVPVTILYGVAGSFIGRLAGGLLNLGFFLTLVLSIVVAGLLITASNARS